LEDLRLDFHHASAADATRKAALKGALRMPLLTFPTIFVRGACLGGLEQLRDAASGGDFNRYLIADWTPFPNDGGASFADPLKLTTGPRGQRWYVFQWHVFANFVRALSLLHVALFAVCLLMNALKLPSITFIIITVMVLDLIFFVILGPTPIAPLGTLVTRLVWRFRGNAAPSFPYKVVLGFYVFTLGSALLCGDGVACMEKASTIASFGSLLINSALLAFFRF